MDRIEEVVLSGPLEHRLNLCRVRQAAAADFSNQPHACVVHFLEVLLGQTVHQNQRAAMNLHGSARTEMVEYTLGHDRSGLTADGVIIETGPAGALLAFGDDAGGAAVQSVSIAADSAALRSIVVERIVNVAVDEARADNLAVDVDNSLDAGLVNFVFKADLPLLISPLMILSMDLMIRSFIVK